MRTLKLGRWSVLLIAYALLGCGDNRAAPDPASPDDAGLDATPSYDAGCLEEGETYCDGLCVDTMTTREYCGGCDTSCDLSQTCEAGECGPRCGGPCEEGFVCSVTSCTLARCGLDYNPSSQGSVTITLLDLEPDVANVGAKYVSEVFYDLAEPTTNPGVAYVELLDFSEEVVLNSKEVIIEPGEATSYRISVELTAPSTAAYYRNRWTLCTDVGAATLRNTFRAIEP